MQIIMITQIQSFKCMFKSLRNESPDHVTQTRKEINDSQSSGQITTSTKPELRSFWRGFSDPKTPNGSDFGQVGR